MHTVMRNRTDIWFNKTQISSLQTSFSQKQEFIGRLQKNAKKK